MKASKGQWQLDCPNCSGIHFGQRFDACPYIKSPCSACSDPTIYACSDCAIDSGNAVHVCEKAACQTAHEIANPKHLEYKAEFHQEQPT